MKTIYLITLILFPSLGLICCISPKVFNYNAPPKPTDFKNAMELECVSKSISDSILLKIYPFDSDSIIVFYPDSCCDNLRIEQVYEDNYHYLKNMNKNEIAKLAKQFIGYYYKKDYKGIILSENITEFYRPDIYLLFYKNGKKDYLKMFFSDNHVRFESSFDEETNLYFNEWCKDLESRLKLYFQKYFNYTIQECEDCDYIFNGILTPRYEELELKNSTLN